MLHHGVYLSESNQNKNQVLPFLPNQLHSTYEQASSRNS